MECWGGMERSVEGSRATCEAEGGCVACHEKEFGGSGADGGGRWGSRLESGDTASGELTVCTGGSSGQRNVANTSQIPGVTIPLSHFPTVALALVVNQLIHELGHAISGAM